MSTARVLARLALLVSPLASPLAAQSTSAPAAADSTVGRRRLVPLPAIASAPETGLQLGVTMLAVFEPAPSRHARPATVVPTVLRSAKGQTRVSVDGDYWTRNNARRLQALLAWQRFPLPFYGIGDRTPATAKETYTPQGVEATITGQQRIRGAWYGLGSYRVVSQTITSDPAAGILRTNTLTGSTGGTTAEGTVGLLRDSRDAVFNPHRGMILQASMTAAHRALGSQFAYQRTRLEYRQYVPLPQQFTLAVHLLAIRTAGDRVPFDQLAMVGASDIMRGYERGRYRRTALAAQQLELRTPIRHRLGAVAFGGVGRLDSDSASASARLLPTYGAGLRVELDPRQRTAVRIDYGRGRDGASGLYIGFNQAF